MPTSSRPPISRVVEVMRDSASFSELGINPKERRRRLIEITKIIRKHQITQGVSPEKLRLLFEDLGPTFVKIGQLLSMRSEILPEKYRTELTKLRTDVAPMPFEQVVATLSDQYGQPLDALFSKIDPMALGSASVAQVHRAMLVDGSEVAIKVQRPGVQELMAQDISLMRRTASGLNLVLKSDSIIDMTAVVDELWETFQEETDFLLEAANLDEFARRNATVDFIRCPRPYHDLCTKRVLVMEYVDGIPISNLKELQEAGYDLAEIGIKLVDNYAKQVLDDGYFHGDPHPGNIFVSQGHIVYIDLGMMGRLSGSDQSSLGEIIYAVGEKDTPRLKQAILTFAVSHDVDEIDHAQLLDDLDLIVNKYGTVELANLDLGAFLNEVFGVASRNHIRLPVASSMVAKGLVTLEGVLDECLPDINIVEIIKDHITSKQSYEKMITDEIEGFALDSRKATRQTLKGLVYTSEVMQMLTRGQLKFNFEIIGSEKPISKLGVMADRVTLGLVTAGLFIGSSILYTANLHPKLFGIPILGFLGYVGAAGLSLWIIGDIWRSRSHRK